MVLPVCSFFLCLEAALHLSHIFACPVFIVEGHIIRALIPVFVNRHPASPFYCLLCTHAVEALLKVLPAYTAGNDHVALIRKFFIEFLGNRVRLRLGNIQYRHDLFRSNEIFAGSGHLPALLYFYLQNTLGPQIIGLLKIQGKIILF